MSLPDGITPEELELGEHLDPDERDLEAPTSDAVEQATLADPSQDRSEPGRFRDEVNEYDALEQTRIVDLDDDYRP